MVSVGQRLWTRLQKFYWPSSPGAARARTLRAQDAIHPLELTSEAQIGSRSAGGASGSRSHGGGLMRQRSLSVAALPRPTGILPPFSFASAHRFLVNSVLKRVTNTQAAILRRKTAQQLFTGQAGPFLALVGVSLASGTGLITKDDEVECVCSEIRQAAAKMQALAQNPAHNIVSPSDAINPIADLETTCLLKDFQIGPIVAKGCNAVVLAARWARHKVADLNEAMQTLGQVPPAVEIAVPGPAQSDSIVPHEEEYPLAIKMMFNYEAESNAMAIISAMNRETVPARNVRVPPHFESWIAAMREKSPTLPPHPNIVDMYTAFADYVPEIKEALNMYPDALPRRLNPEGLGRNMSLFLVMKKYDISLKDFLAQHRQEVSWKTSLLILTQILEGLTHMWSHGIAHRDLKSDNILLDLSGGIDFPRVVITDFGCCLADRNHGLKMPYSSFETNRGGNMALMAPEVITAQPGPFTSINYDKADVWACGAIAYEIFGMANPFYQDNHKLLNMHYKSKQLPSLPEDIPDIVNNLVRDLLRRNPKNRLSAELAATISQLILWAPSTWAKANGRIPNTQDVLQWLLTLTTKILCESRFANDGKALREYQLVATFLSRMSLSRVKEALQWMKNNAG
ncbi:serine/threonine-protein kinase Pink1, mitochondrial-like [Tigriopus californicus]|uniref:serine/threonine-protein kinase Pink1, mitochondrial-like n=1 Tax=Tigriopus californicus TaxID=6832 RepID=UPI0027D9E793|nr:serine/threonine-protein kinase Pink1, mitochondrial-like [Tigriopus californicus]